MHQSTLKHVASQSVSPRFHPVLSHPHLLSGQPCDFSHPDNNALLCFRSQVHKAFPLSRSSCALASKSRHSREETLDGGPTFLRNRLRCTGCGARWTRHWRRHRHRGDALQRQLQRTPLGLPKFILRSNTNHGSRLLEKTRHLGELLFY